MYIVGEGSIAAKRLCSLTFEAMWKGIVKVRPGARLGDIGHAIQTFAENQGFSVVREFCGHGVGTRFHEEPQVLHYGRPGTLEELVPGMMFTIEPMINAGKRDIRKTARAALRRLDHRHARPLAVGAVGAHGARHRQRLRGAHVVGRQPAAAGLRDGVASGGRHGLSAMSAVAQPANGAGPGVASLRLRSGDDKAALIEQFAAARPSATGGDHSDPRPGQPGRRHA